MHSQIINLHVNVQVLYFDADVIFRKNCDDMFQLNETFVALSGINSPVNSGIFVVKPSWQSVIDIADVASTMSFNPSTGWLSYGLIPDWRAGHEHELTDWSFYGASVDQGLLYYYFFCAKYFGTGKLLPSGAWEDRITHFTGKNKPFLTSTKPIRSLPARFRRATELWRDIHMELDARVTGLHLARVDHAPITLIARPAPGYPLFDPYPPPGFFSQSIPPHNNGH